MALLLLFKCLLDICSTASAGQFPCGSEWYSWHCPGGMMGISSVFEAVPWGVQWAMRFRLWFGIDSRTNRQVADVVPGWLAGWRICPIKSFALRQPCQTSVWFLSKVFDFKSLRSTYLVQGETGEWHWCVSSGMIFSCCSSMFGFEGPLTHPFARGSLSYVACPGWGAY